MLFDLESAHLAAKHNRLEQWVHDYLLGPGRNPAFSEGLRLRPRSWRGAELLPIAQLRRKCGPEPGMEFPVSDESWSTRITEIKDTFTTLEAFPPLIVEAVGGELMVCDGSHRIGAFTALGIDACWAIVWFTIKNGS